MSNYHTHLLIEQKKLLKKKLKQKIVIYVNLVFKFK